MTDRVETICGCLVQHGHHSDRIYVMHLNPGAAGRLIPAMDPLAVDRCYGKITAKIPASCWKPFNAAGYRHEATVPGFLNGRTKGFSSPSSSPPGGSVRNCRPRAPRYRTSQWDDHVGQANRGYLRLQACRCEQLELHL